MKATIDIPDPLYRQVKARAALEGRAIREVAIELFTDWLGDVSTVSRAPATAMDAWLASWQEIGRQVADAAPDGPPLGETIRAERR